MKLIAKSQYKRMPWKNGLGMTEEIAISPEGTKFPDDAFLWRLSAASVTAANSFSLFPGYDRLLAIWKGNGLIVGDQRLEPGQCLHFAGELPLACSLINGPVTDLGLIYDRQRVEAEMRVVRFEQGRHTLSLSVGTHFVVSLRGGFNFAGGVANEGDTLRVDREDAIELECHGPVELSVISIQLKDVSTSR